MQKEQFDTGDPLADSRRIQDAASSLGFDWPDITGVFGKVREELKEIEVAYYAGDHEHARRELGDVLFALVNLGRFLKTDPAEQLHCANRRFMRRFDMLKSHLESRGRKVEQCTLAELDEVWEKVKREIKNAGDNA